MDGKLIRLFLTDGDAEGIIEISPANKALSVTLCPRSCVQNLLGTDTYQLAGIYILIGGLHDTKIYIGQAAPVGNRIRQHLIDKSFWSKVLIFTSNDKYFSRTQITYIEARLIDMVNRGLIECDNRKKEPIPNLTSAALSEVESYIEDIVLITDVLRFNFFTKMNKLSLIDLILEQNQELVTEPLFDSIIEQKFIQLLEHSQDVIRWFRPTYEQFKIEWDKRYSYTPDFIVETSESCYIVEVIGSLSLDPQSTLIKKQAAEKYCDNLNMALLNNSLSKWFYRILDDKEISQSLNIMGLLKGNKETL